MLEIDKYDSSITSTTFYGQATTLLFVCLLDEEHRHMVTGSCLCHWHIVGAYRRSGMYPRRKFGKSFRINIRIVLKCVFRTIFRFNSKNAAAFMHLSQQQLRTIEEVPRVINLSSPTKRSLRIKNYAGLSIHSDKEYR